MRLGYKKPQEVCAVSGNGRPATAKYGWEAQYPSKGARNKDEEAREKG